MSEVILDTLIDSIKLVPFLFLTYLAMEYLEHKAGEKTTHMVRKAGKMGPLIGGVAGVLPQCGFSAAASNLYAGRVITLGTLIAIYLSTSDEMLPILISEKMDIRFVLGVPGAKAAIGAAAGFVIGAYIPISQFSDGVQTFCNLFPASHVTILFRNVILNGLLDEIDNCIGGLDQGMFVSSMKECFTFEAQLFGNSFSQSNLICYVAGAAVLCVVIMIFVYARTYKRK